MRPTILPDYSTFSWTEKEFAEHVESVASLTKEYRGKDYILHSTGKNWYVSQIGSTFKSKFSIFEEAFAQFIKLEKNNAVQ